MPPVRTRRTAMACSMRPVKSFSSCHSSGLISANTEVSSRSSPRNNSSRATKVEHARPFVLVGSKYDWRQVRFAPPGLDPTVGEIHTGSATCKSKRWASSRPW